MSQYAVNVTILCILLWQCKHHSGLSTQLDSSERVSIEELGLNGDIAKHWKF